MSKETLSFLGKFENSQQISQHGDLANGLGTSREFDFGGQWNLITELPQNWGNRLLEGTSKILCAPEPRRKEQWSHKRLSQTCLWVCRSLWQKCGLTVAYCGVIIPTIVWPEVQLWWGNGNLLQKNLCLHTAPRTVVVSAPDTVAGHCQSTPPPETPGHSQASLAQSLVGWLLLGPGAHKVSLCPPRVCFPGGSQSFSWICRLGNLL